MLSSPLLILITFLISEVSSYLPPSSHILSSSAPKYYSHFLPKMTSKLHQSIDKEIEIDEGSRYSPYRFRVRTVTAFVQISSDDFTHKDDNDKNEGKVYNVVKKIRACHELLLHVSGKLQERKYEVQTIRIATNPFGEYLLPPEEEIQQDKAWNNFIKRLDIMKNALMECGIGFCSLGPAISPTQIKYCPYIVASCPIFSCSAILRTSHDVEMAKYIAECMKQISRGESSGKLFNEISKEDAQNTIPDYLQKGVGNFRFCMTSCCNDGIPFFPSAFGQSLSTNQDSLSFAIGLENGSLIKDLIEECQTLDSIKTVFKEGYRQALIPIQSICESVAGENPYHYKGIDTSINPSLEKDGSVGSAISQVDVVSIFGGSGTLAVAAELTKAIQTLEDIKTTGYSGLMLPVCEDLHLASLATTATTSRQLTITDLLSISSVCGVGLDTIPIPGDCSTRDLMSIILDVAALSFRWNKSLSCRLLLCPGQRRGEVVEFGSPYMCDCQIFDV